MKALNVIVIGMAASLSLTAFAAPAQSAGGNAPAGQRQVVLQYRSADLATPAALEQTYLRISRAAQQVCQPYAGRELARQRIFQRCLDATLAAAVAAVQDPRMVALHGSRALPVTGAAAPVRTAQR